MATVERYSNFEELKSVKTPNSSSAEKKTEEKRPNLLKEEFAELLRKGKIRKAGVQNLMMEQAASSSYLSELVLVCKTLNDNGVQYMLIGGAAVGFMVIPALL